MMIAPLLAALLAVSASAATPCKSNDMTAAWEKIAFALWLTDYTIPDSSPRTATLAYRNCTAGDDGFESRNYASADGFYVVTALTFNGGEDGSTNLLLRRGGRTAYLGGWRHHKVFYKGVGIDKVSVPNGGGEQTVVKNVFVIPEGAVIKP